MKDILIIFTVLLLLLITISTLGGSLSFVAKNGRNEYFSDASSTAKGVVIPQPVGVKKPPAAPTAVATPADAKKAASFTQLTSPAVAKAVASPVTTAQAATTASKETLTAKSLGDKIEGFEGPMYAIA